MAYFNIIRITLYLYLNLLPFERSIDGLGKSKSMPIINGDFIMNFSIVCHFLFVDILHIQTCDKLFTNIYIMGPFWHRWLLR